MVSELDTRPNLLELSPEEFEHLVHNLLSRMGLETRLFRRGNDGGIDCVAYDPRPITGGKFVVQAKLYTRTVPLPVAAAGGVLLSLAGGLVVWLLVRRTTSRFGGVTGDVMGAAIELALATTLLTWSWVSWV